MVFKCCVPGCDFNNSQQMMHSFPKEADCFEKWCAAIERKDLLSLDMGRVRKGYRVCDVHFEDTSKFMFNRNRTNLIYGSIPSINIPVRHAEIENVLNEEVLITQEAAEEQSQPGPSRIQDKNQELVLRVQVSQEQYGIGLSEVQTATKKLSEESISSQNDNLKELDHSGNQAEIISNLNEQNITVDENQNSNKAEIDELQVDTGPFAADNQEKANQTSSPIKKPYFKSIKYMSDCNKFNEVCRVCFCSLIKEEEVVKLYGEETSIEDQTRIKNMLNLVLPDMDLEIFLNITICTKCTKLLEYSYQLKQTWLSAEAKLQRILEKKRAATNQNADLVIAKKGIKNKILSEIDYDYVRISINQKQTDEKKEMTYRLFSSSGSSEEDIFDDESSMSNPIETKSVEHFLCEYCGRLCFSPSSYRRHCQVHPEPECSICRKKIENFETMKSDIHIAHIRGTFQCHLCGKQFANQSNFNKHSLLHNSSKKLHTCNICDKKFGTYQYMRNHLRAHVIAGSWTCTHCGKCLKYEKSLQKHIKLVHMKQGEFVCEYCNKPFWKKEPLLKHRIRVHGWSHQVQKVQQDAHWENEAHLGSS